MQQTSEETIRCRFRATLPNSGVGVLILFQLTYTVDRRHWKEFNKLAYRRTMVWYRFAAGLFLGLSAVAVSAFFEHCRSCNIDSISATAGMAAFYVLACIIDYFRYYTHLWNSAGADGSVLGVRELIASDEGIQERKPHASTLFRWEAIEAMTEGKMIAVLWTDKMAGVIIPRNAFGSPEEIIAFQQFISARATKLKS